MENHRSERSTQRDGDRRPPLNWQEDEKIQYGDVIGTLNSAILPGGKRIFSWCIGKESKRDDRVLKFLDPRDLKDAHAVLDDIQDWIDDERKSGRGS